MLAYNAEGHRHAPEIEEKLKAISKNCIIDLNTSHGNFRRGIHMRISLNVKSNLINKINRDKIIKIYKDFYYKKNNDFQFIQVLNTKRTLKK